MKKVNAALAGMFCLSLISCNQQAKFMLEGDFDATSLVKIDNYTLQSMITNKQSFVLNVSLETCETCASFTNNILNNYIKETKALIYKIDLLELENSENYANKPMATEAPQIYIYNEGQIVDNLKYDYDKSEFNDVSAFKNYLDKFIITPRLLTISEASLDQKIANNESFLLYIGWNKCGDCKLLEERILNDYLLNNYNDNVIYYLESDPYRSLKPASEPIRENYTDENQYLQDKENYDNWVNFTKKYHFDVFRNGRIPTLQYYQNGVTSLDKMLVYHNDVINENNIVSESFFNECIGQTYTSDELLKYHDQKALEYLDKYYKNI